MPRRYARRVSGTIQSVERAIALLRALAARSEPVPLGVLASSLGLAKTTAHGLLATLVDVGAAAQEDGGYRIAEDPWGGRRELLDPHVIRAHALNWSDALASRTGLAVHVTVVRSGTVTVVHEVLGDVGGAAFAHVGDELPAHATAAGRVHLAYDAVLARRVTAGAPDRYTSRTVIDVRRLAQTLAAVREQGIAVDIGEFRPELGSLGAPIRGRGGEVVAAIAVGGPSAGIADASGRPVPRVVDRVVAAARQVSRELGHGKPL